MAHLRDLGTVTSNVHGAFFDPTAPAAQYVCRGCAAIIDLHPLHPPTPMPPDGFAELRENAVADYLQPLRRTQEAVAKLYWG